MATQLTISQIIAIGDSSVAYADNNFSDGVVFGARKTKLTTSVLIAYVTDGLRWGYEAGQSDSALRGLGNYLIWLCGIFGQQARSGSAGGSVIPIPPTTPFVYLIPITGADFEDATNYNDTRIVGKQLQIFWNDINRYLLSSEYSGTSTGVNILVPGFDATANPTYELLISIVNP